MAAAAGNSLRGEARRAEALISEPTKGYLPDYGRGEKFLSVSQKKEARQMAGLTETTKREFAKRVLGILVSNADTLKKAGVDINIKAEELKKTD